MTAERLLIVSCVDGVGPTGVDTHMRAVQQLARDAGLAAEIVHPHGVRTPAVLAWKVAHRIARWMGRVDQATHASRAGYAAALKHKLRDTMRAAAGARTTVYAQDSISSGTAAAVRRESRDAAQPRIVTVVHFNESEAAELIAKGLAVPGGRTDRAVMAQEQRSIAAADRIVFVSDYMRKRVLARYPAEVAARTRLIGNWPEAEIEPAGPAAERDLIAIGTLEPRKNQAFLLDVLAACAVRGRRYTLTFVGDGPDRAMLEARAQALGLADAVHFAGRVANGQTEIARHRAVIHGAHLENMPITLIEALAHGRPVFALPVGGIPEIVRDGEEGLYLTAGDPDASAARIIALLDDPARLAAMGQAARTRFDTRFSAQVSGAALLALLREDAGASGGAVSAPRI